MPGAKTSGPRRAIGTGWSCVGSWTGICSFGPNVTSPAGSVYEVPSAAVTRKSAAEPIVSFARPCVRSTRTRFSGAVASAVPG